jgi:hypothetical protein
MQEVRTIRDRQQNESATTKKKVSKDILVTGRGGLYCYEMLRISHCLDNRFIDGGKVVSPTHQPHFTPQKHYFFKCFRYSFLLEAEWTLGPSAAGRPLLSQNIAMALSAL